MDKLEKIIYEYFEKECDIRDEEHRISFLAILVSKYNNYDISKIRKELKILSDLLEKSHSVGLLDEQKKKENDALCACKKDDKSCSGSCKKLRDRARKEIKQISDEIEDIFNEILGEEE